MAAATVIPPGGGEVVGDSPDRRVEILSDTPGLAVTWSRFGPGRDGADLHVHREHTDFFYVLDGELTIRLGHEGREVPLPAGTLVRVPPMVVHGFRNASGSEVRYLNLHAPGVRFPDYLRSIRDGSPITYDQFDPPAGGTHPPSDAQVGEVVSQSSERGAAVKVLAAIPALEVSEVTVSGDGWEPPPAGDGVATALYVLDGDAVITTGGGTVQAPRGAWVQVAPGAAWSLACPAPVRVFVTRAAA
jgi:mannose-6-phosphate isomerase-like protein (cupin superfamily)